MRRLAGLFQPRALELMRTFTRHELMLMEQGTPLGFFLSFINNCLMLLMFHLLFVTRFLVGVPNTWVYLLLGIVQWNLYINVSMAGFACLVYRQKLVMGYSFPREMLILARTAAVSLPYLFELSLILLVARYFDLPLGVKYLWLPIFLVAQFFFCASLCTLFAFVGVLHKNIIPFWNIMFRLLSFATPIFYVPMHFGTPWVNVVYDANPFTIFMIWIRDITASNGFDVSISPVKILLGSALGFLVTYVLFRSLEAKVGDSL
jgi:ABC-type polysaccharide/polyol phosphate export permease